MANESQSEEVRAVPIGIACKQIPMPLRNLQQWLQRGAVVVDRNEKGHHMFTPADIARCRALRKITLNNPGTPLNVALMMLDTSAMQKAYEIVNSATVEFKDGKAHIGLILGPRRLHAVVNGAGDIELSSLTKVKT